MRSVVLIPARHASSRYPGKPLVNLLGKPMILWVAELSAKAVGANNVYVATDDKRISTVVESAGFNTVMTSSEALTGTDRSAEAAEKIDADIYINVQGDEPLANPDDIIKIRDAKLNALDKVVNGFTWISDQEFLIALISQKVITNEIHKLIYMSRLALPGFKENKNAPRRYKKQVCIYAFTKEELISYKAFGRKSKLEHCEDIEILNIS